MKKNYKHISTGEKIAKRILPFIMVLLIVWAVSFVEAESDRNKGDISKGENFDLKRLAGLWAGAGEITIPITNISISVTGDAEFVFDSVKNVLRTSLTARKFLFAYSDSGYLSYNAENDSMVWEVWDSFGKYSRYLGQVEDGSLRGEYPRRDGLYRVTVDFITDDSLLFKLMVDKKGKSKTKATLDLWRVQKR